ncbi:hypothetical protein GCM10011374_38560 [Kocuria dechangensis]|uniref:Uncharacterized protein n=1 Tax=Kocuria dechangensis TaxID=1176249 RepID=A0A917H7N2_9MICC|nr:hypothetical protein GCM10011374_38560 [Kocuria dechangensis]
MNLAPLIQAAAARGAVACEQCNADYSVSRDPECPNLTHLTVMHDDDCPFYLRRMNRAGRRAAGRTK